VLPPRIDGAASGRTFTALVGAFSHLVAKNVVSMTDKPPARFANTTEFYAMLGAFYAAWSRAELVVDCAIWKILGTTQRQAHILVGAMEFGRKAAVLRSLLPRSNYKNLEQIKGLLTRISKSRRNEFSHSILASKPDLVRFIHRRAQGEYCATPYVFSPAEFAQHVDDFRKLVLDFEKTLELSDKEIGDFASAAIFDEDK
jgi:hypothetical protein